MIFAFTVVGVVERSGGIIANQAIPHGLVQALLEQSVDVPHGVFAQTWVFRAFRAVTTKPLSLLQKIAHLLCGQLLQRDLAQPGEDVVLEEIPMGGVVGRAALILVIDLLPAEDIRSQRHIPTSLHWRCRFRKAAHGKLACFRIRLWR